MKQIKEKMVHRTKTQKREGNKDKEHCHRSYLFLGMGLAIVLLLAGAGVASANVTYDSSKIVISNGAETLTSINDAINDTSLLEQLSSNEWLLKMPILVQGTGILCINDTDCKWLKMLSLNNGNEVYIKNYGIFEIKDTKITSWNTGTNDFAPIADNTRAYIYTQPYRGPGKMNVYNSTLSYLGAGSPWGAYGVTWVDCDDFDIVNSIFESNYYGIGANGASNATVTDCTIKSSVSRGACFWSYSVNCTFDNNTLIDCGNGGIYISGVDSCNNTITNNTIYGKAGNICINVGAHHNYIAHNYIHHAHPHGGIDLHTNVHYNTVEYNVLHDVGIGIYGSHAIYIHNEGSSNNVIRHNTMWNIDSNVIDVTMAHNNTVFNNTIGDNCGPLVVNSGHGNIFESCNASSVEIVVGSFSWGWDAYDNLFIANNVSGYVSEDIQVGCNTIRNAVDSFTAQINGATGVFTIKFTDNRTFKLEGDTECHTSTTLTGLGTYTIEIEGTVGDTIPPTTNTVVMPAPNESGWNTVTPVTVIFFRSDNDSGISYTNYSKISETGPWTMVTTSAATGHDAENVTDISESGFDVTLSEEGTTEIWYHSVDTNSNVETTKNVTVKIDTTPTDPEHPDWWGYYVGSGEGTWGRTTREAHTGNYSAFLKGTAYETDYINLGLIAGKSNGYSGPDAYTVVPNTTYDLSFWLKGDFTKIDVHAMTWNTEDGSSGREWGSTSIGWITPTEMWTRYEGTFTTASDAKKFVLMFKAEGDSIQENLGTIYVDDVDVNVGEGNLMMNPGVEDTDFCALSGTVTTNTSQGETGLANATVTLTTVEGTEINTIQTDSTGRYEFTDVSPGNYNINATKRSYWPDSDPVTVTTEAPETADIELSQKGDYNTNSEPADAGDLAMMADATAAGTSDVTYDLDGDGNPADEADLTLLKDVSVGVAELE